MITNCSFTPRLSANLFVVTLMFYLKVFAQPIVFNQCSTVVISPGLLVMVNGDVWNTASGNIVNNGTVTIANSGNLGSLYLKGNSVLSGSGLYRVEQDWENDATFIADTSTVELFSSTAQQFITSTNNTPTTFHNLHLTGLGAGNARKKSLKSTNAGVDATGVLIISDRELDTDTNTFYVNNPSVSAIMNATVFGNEGFVSSIGNGSLSRVVNSTSTYFYPTGSSLGTTRYRPVFVTPSTSLADTFSARLVNALPTNTNKLDTATVCGINLHFFHKVKRAASFTTSAAVEIYYDQIADGNWDGIAQWNTPLVSYWNGLVGATNNAFTNYSSVKKANWNNFSNDSMVLSKESPVAPSIACIDSICANKAGNSISASGSGTFVWATPSGTQISSGQGTSTILVDWNNSPGPISVYQVAANGCKSAVSVCNISVASLPQAGFAVSSSGDMGTVNSFIDQSQSVVSWQWSFGDGSTSQESNPVHMFEEPGTYSVLQTVTNAYGCSNSFSETIVIKDSLFIPSGFSPNGDGINDTFVIRSAFKNLENTFEVYNRWGDLVYTLDNYRNQWDGSVNVSNPALGNDKVVSGTYFYVFTTKYDNKSYKGYLELRY
ncbi:MAG: gliding motility-associated C-terminal domain-containing protein [Bacteroidetes bacterium]|nr:gliding motility-associated C-terminal domain-containing protein [Bacteroidota bacterium]